MEQKNIHPKGLENLIHGIVKRAVEDYQIALQDNDKIQIDALEKFFRSAWFGCMTTVDGNYIIKRAKETMGKKHLNRKRLVKQKPKKKKCDKSMVFVTKT